MGPETKGNSVVQALSAEVVVMTGKLVFHLPKQFLENYAERPHLAIFQRIQNEVVRRGGEVEVRRRHEALRDNTRSDWSDVLEDYNFHIIENGTVNQGNALNAALAYLPPYYHLFKCGVLARSPAQNAQFDPGEVNSVLAEAFVSTLRHRLVGNRRTRYGPKKEFTEIPDGCIAVFLQGDNPHHQGTAQCDTETLLRTVAAGANGRQVIVKAHPISRQLQDAQLIHRLLQDGVPLIATDANIHDILARCAATVSFNSAVSMEGFLHEKPTILFGDSDFHHVAETVRRPSSFPEALRRALAGKREYSKFLYWYFSTFCLSVEHWNVGGGILSEIEKAGFGSAAFGLAPTPHSEKCAAEKQKKAAIKEMMGILNATKVAKDVSLRACEVDTHEFQRFLGRIDTEKVTVARFCNTNGACDVEAVVKRVNRLQVALQDGPFVAPHCILARPEVGLLVVRHVPGKPLFEKIQASEGQRREKLMRLGAAWLKSSSQGCCRLQAMHPMDEIANISQHLDLIIGATERKLAERLLTRLEIWARQNMRIEIWHTLSVANFNAAHLRFHHGTVCPDSFRKEAWVPMVQAAASFLTFQASNEAVSLQPRTYGILSQDWHAFLSSDVADSKEIGDILPFFVGLQFLGNLMRQAQKNSQPGNARIPELGFIEDFTVGEND